MPSSPASASRRGRVGRIARATLLLPLSAAACGVLDEGTQPEDFPAEGEGTLGEFVWSGGRPRTYELHVPTTVTPASAAPLLIFYHGFGSSAAAFRSITGLDSIADRLEFVVAYPDGVLGSWGVGCGCTTADNVGVNDVLFTATLIDHLQRELSIDLNRVYVAGFSQGGAFVQRLACNFSDRLAAIVVGSATLYRVLALDCLHPGPAPMLFFHGTEDPSFLWEGNPSVLSVAANLETWADLNGCNITPISEPLPDVADDGTTVTRETYPDCDAGSEVVLYAIEGGGHTWPGTSAPFTGLGLVSGDISASEILAEFMLRHRLN